MGFQHFAAILNKASAQQTHLKGYYLGQVGHFDVDQQNTIWHSDNTTPSKWS